MGASPGASAAVLLPFHFINLPMRTHPTRSIDPLATFEVQAVPIAAPLPPKVATVQITSPVDLLVTFGSLVSALTAASFLVLAGTSEPMPVPEGAKFLGLAWAPPCNFDRKNRTVCVRAA